MKIKYSKRGLTFSFKPTDTFSVGTKYRYFVNLRTSEIVLVADDDGKYRISQKGQTHKPLVDLRNAEIKEAISLAEFMEVEIAGNEIIIKVIKKDVNVDNLNDIDLKEVFDNSHKDIFHIDKDTLIHDEKLSEELNKHGILIPKIMDDISYVFDVVSLFSGAGMLDYPYKEDESFNIKFAVDFDKNACETYRHMIGDHILCMDMRDLKEEDVPSADLIIGGPCCQGYSNANRSLTGSETARAKRKLIDDYIRVVKAKKPLVFLVENVPQFLTKDAGEHLYSIISNLPEYEITYSIVNDNEVGGYSTRKRMILIGSRIGKIEIPFLHIAPKTCQDALDKVDATWNHYNDCTIAKGSTAYKMAMVSDGQNYKAIPELENLDRHSNVYRRLSPDAPSVTITNWRKVNLMPPLKYLKTDNKGNSIQRQLSCAEAMAIQGLPKTFRFYGSKDAIQQQIGNGVTQAVARFTKAIIKNALVNYANSLLPC